MDPIESRGSDRDRVVGRAAVSPPRDDQPTLNLPPAAPNGSPGYVGLRGDIKARNRSGGPRYRSPEVAL